MFMQNLGIKPLTSTSSIDIPTQVFYNSLKLWQIFLEENILSDHGELYTNWGFQCPHG